MDTLPSNKTFRIFAVDDAPEIRIILDGALKDDDWLVTVFESSEEVVEACKKKMPDLLISDLIMPKMQEHFLEHVH